MSEPVRIPAAPSRSVSLGILLFAIAWVSLMVLILMPRDMITGTLPGQILRPEPAPAVFSEAP
ncbi:hypothetical protein [Pseudogemmobacter faecipullorum]|uniref:DUF2182 domain-containing protein n=1 Tax=Pseudogemmobacter faecipullorum TaxID=2755041 RepID=A0ABS8CKJ3_9RHOB|nr:hypothetical protein [Pseudogemmobacter faecipullorum]MCB5409871.1 hypothetical protein [Pseudogemmobacter faecipullorum]